MENNSMNSIKNKNLIWISVSVLFSVMLFFCNVSFSEPDDYLVFGIFSGVYGNGVNSVFIHYINVIYGCLTKLLNAVIGRPVGWGIILLLLLTYSFSVLHIIFTIIRDNIIPHLLIVLAQVMFGLFFLTYTVIAYLVSGISLVLFSLCMLNLINDNARKYEIASLVGIVLGVLLRPNVLMSLVALMLPLLIRAFNCKEKRKTIVRDIFIVTVSMSFFIGLNKLIILNNPVWDNYIKWDNQSIRIRDYAIDWEALDIKEELKDVGWEYNDLLMITSWDFADNNILSTEKMSVISSSVPINKRYELNIKILAGLVVKDYKIIALVLICFICLFTLKSRKDWLYIFMAFSLTILLLMSLYVRKRYVDRVSIPIYFLGLLQMSVLYCLIDGKKNKSVKKWYGSAVLLICTIIALMGALSSIAMRYKSIISNAPQNDLLNYFNNNQNITYVVNSGVVNSIYINKPIKDLRKSDYPKNVFKSGSWDLYSGRYYRMIKKRGLNESLFKSLYECDDVMFMTTNNDEVKRVSEFISYHYKGGVAYSVEGSFKDIMIYKFSE